MANTEVSFRPSFPNICDFFSAIIDIMVISVKELPRIEHLLFCEIEDLAMSFISTVQLEEVIVGNAKERIKTVIYANSYGPLR